MRSEIYINLNNDHNTIDSFGLKSLFNLCRRLYTKIHIYSQDIPSDTFSDEDIQYDINEFKTFNDYLDYNLKKYLMEPNHRYIVSFSSLPCSPSDCMSPGRPKIWSPWKCVINILDIFIGLTFV